ncbi:MAG: hypothetical protein JSS69_06480 [Acidobacteria bacterium]|nr:hypothetical protein [Acidobacteriota bacterium]MBS1865550.1 hypothetical protein [Acidobacteriota bacterium]
MTELEANSALSSRQKRVSLRGKRPFGFLLLFCIAAILFLAASPHAVAQGCAMCYQSASASGPRTIHALRNGIIILIIPPMFICTAITFLVYRRRNLYSGG